MNKNQENAKSLIKLLDSTAKLTASPAQCFEFAVLMQWLKEMSEEKPIEIKKEPIKKSKVNGKSK